MFRKLFFSSLSAMTLSGAVGIVLAHIGLGVWALVAQQFLKQLVTTVMLWFTVKWRPTLAFSFKRVKTLFSFGWKLLASALIDTLNKNLQTLVIGRIYNPQVLGFYNSGLQFPEIIVSNVNGSIQSVMFPALSLHQENKDRVKRMVRRAIVTSSFIMFPIMVGLAVSAESVIKIMLTERWLPSVPFFQIFCFSFSLWPIHTTNLQAINALGRSDIFLKLEIIKKFIGIIILVISIPFGIYAMAWGVLLISLLSTFINAYPNLGLINYSYKEQWQDILPPLLMSLVAGVVIYPFNFLDASAWLILAFQIIICAIVYIGLAMIFKVESLNYLMGTIKDVYRNRKEG